MSTEKVHPRVNVYIDGFNLYHAVVELKDNDLKWLNFRSLSESFLRPGEELGEVYFFTAVVTWNREKEERHKNFNRAQKHAGVTVVNSKFKKSKKFCEEQQVFCKRHEEKQTDVAFATTVLADAFEGKSSRSILLTADTDQVPLIKQLRRLCPHVMLTLAIPPNRKDHARELGLEIPDRLELDTSRMLAHRLPKVIKDEKGRVVAKKPAFYDGPCLAAPMRGAPHPTAVDEDPAPESAG